MRIATRVVIDLETMEVVDGDYFDYVGPVEECKGGGGSSGTVDYPEYMKAAHEDWLTQSGVDAIETSITDVMNSALGSSPYAGLAPYDPDTDLAANDAAITAFAAILSGIDDDADWAALYTQALTSLGSPATLTIADASVANKTAPTAISAADKTVADISVSDITDITDVAGIDETTITDDVTAFSDNLDDELDKILPRFRRGMQDINAVCSSAFVIGEAIIAAFKVRDVAKHNSALRLAAASKNADIEMGNEQMHLDVKKTNVMKSLEVAKSNLTKTLQLAQINLNKDLEIAKTNNANSIAVDATNLSKDVDIAKLNMTKAVQVADIVFRTDAEYKKMYLAGTEQILRIMLQRISWENDNVRLIVDANRIKIVAKKEESDITHELEVNDAKWDLEVFQHGANLLAAIGGGTNTTSNKPSRVASAIGGGLTGAASGAMMGAQIGAAGGPIGAVGGAVIGGLIGIASAFF